MDERRKQNFLKYYEILEGIGNGPYGNVYKGKKKETNEYRAIKIINYDIIKESLSYKYKKNKIEEQLKLYIKGFIKDYENMIECSKNNENSIKIYEYFNNKNNFVIIMELCDKNLSELLSEGAINKYKGFSIEEILKMINQINNALKIMKKNNIIHKNLKLENILIKYKDKDHKDYTIKITDYGNNRNLNYISNLLYTKNLDIIEFKAPEILNGKNYNYKCDLWSIGIILYKLYFGFSPFLQKTDKSLEEIINRYGNQLLLKSENKDFDDLIINLLEKDPQKRINLDEYFNHPFFKNENINSIYIVYEVDIDETINIFNYNFVDNNKDNIELVIDGMRIELVDRYKLKKGKNKIEMIIKNKLQSLNYMFYMCSNLIDIEGLKNLDVSQVFDFSLAFNQCSSLSNIKALENWDVSNGTDFKGIFHGCDLITDITPLENWDTSNGKSFGSMFSACTSLTDIKPLEKWNVSNGEAFNGMFYLCPISDLKPLKNWNVSKAQYFGGMFSGCSSILDLKPLENWNVSNGQYFEGMFYECSSISDLKALKNWDVSKGQYFSEMFYKCSSLLEIKSLQNWNVSNGYSFKSMFGNCLSITDISPLRNWNIPKGNYANLEYIFYGCFSIVDIDALNNWNTSKDPLFYLA